MVKEKARMGLDAFDRIECFEFLYGAEHEALRQTFKFPTPRQQLFIMFLVSNLQLPLKKYKVMFPYQDVKRQQYLLKPKKRFQTFKNFDEVQSLLEALKELPRQLEAYQKAPSIETYLMMEKNWRKLLVYFSIPQEKQFFANLKKKVPAKSWKLYELEQQKQRLAANASAGIQQWKTQRVSELKASLRILTLDETVLRICLSHFQSQYEEGTRFISFNQKQKLTRLYYESLTWLCLLTQKTDIELLPHSDDYFQFLTFGEAGALMDALERVVKSFEDHAVLISDSPLRVELSAVSCVTKELLGVLNALSRCLPHFKELTTDLKVSNSEKDSYFTWAKVKKLETYLQELEMKLLYFSGVEGFEGIDGFSCSSHEFYCCLEMQNYLIQRLNNNPQPSPQPLTYDDLMEFVSQSEILETLQLEAEEIRFSDDWRFLVTHQLEGNIYIYLSGMNEALFHAQLKQASQKIVYDEMMALLETLPMAHVCD